MNKKLYLAGFMLWVLSLAAPKVFAHGDGAGMGGRGDRFAGEFFQEASFLLRSQEKLGLSAEQSQAIQDLKLEAKKNLIRQQAEIEVLDLDIHSKLQSSKADLESVQKLIDQQYETKKAEAKALAEAYLKLKGTLNPKQSEALENLKKERRKESFEGKAHRRSWSGERE